MSATVQDPVELTPLKHSTYRVLLALDEGEHHGYAIMQALSEMTDGRETILPGTLYAALARMVDEGMLEPVKGNGGESAGGPRRHRSDRHDEQRSALPC